MRARRGPRPTAEHPSLSAPGAADAVDADAAAEQPERGPLRRCILTRESAPKEAMIRFVLAPDRTVLPDLAGNLPGRGFWLSARGDVLETAQKRGAFARAARGPVQLPADLAGLIVAGLRRRIVECLGLARRAGQAVSGFEKVREGLAGGHFCLLVEAADGSAEERRRLIGGRKIEVVAPLEGALLGQVFGRERAVHVALARGRLAERVVTESWRLAGLQGEHHRPGVGPTAGAGLVGVDLATKRAGE